MARWLRLRVSDDTSSSPMPAVNTLDLPLDTCKMRLRSGKYDWEPMRQLARKRARIILEKVWEDSIQNRRIYTVRFRRFCFKDY